MELPYCLIPSPPIMTVIDLNKRQLYLISYNANGIKKQKLEIISLLNELNIDIMCVNETHLRSEDRFNIPNYHTYRYDRPSRGGGTAIIIKRSVSHRPVNIPDLEHIEATAIMLPVNEQEILIAAVYHPPYRNINIPDLEKLTSIHPHFLITGDFNAKHQNWNSRLNSPKGIALNNYALENNLCVLAPDSPTHYPWQENHFPDVLDICIVKAPVLVTELSTINALDSDHLPILIHLSGNFIKIPKPPYKTANTNWEAVTKELHLIVPGNPPISTIEDIDSAVDLLTTTISETYLQHTTYTEPQDRPFAPPHFIYLIKAKRRFRRLWQTTRDPKTKRALNRLQNAIRKSAKNYTIESFEKALQDSQDSSDSWKIIKRLTSDPHPTPSAIRNYHGSTEYTPQGKSETLAYEFEKRFQPHHESSNFDTEAKVNNTI